MSIKHALAFFAAVRRDAGLQAAVTALGPDADLQELVPLAGSYGFPVAASCLQEAYRHDWLLRHLAWYGTTSPQGPAQ